MAALAFPSLAKKVTLSDGTTYSYISVAPSSHSSATFLLLHGYPSSCYDWRHQIHSLSSLGYGVLAPDLLGYGESSKPADPASYRLKRMALHMAELLDTENVFRCVAVGHDWGCGLLSRLITWIPDRLLGAVFVSVGYIEPAMKWDIKAINEQTESMFGYSTNGYWPWHNTEEAIKDCNENPASVFTLIYAAEAALWRKSLGPVGAAANFVKSGTIEKLPSWYGLDEYTLRDRILSIGGYQGPLNWYKAAMRGVNDEDEAGLTDSDKKCGLPVLLAVSDEDYVTRADLQIPATQKWVSDLTIKNFSRCGHWIQLERPEELNGMLVDFVELVTGQDSSLVGSGITQGLEAYTLEEAGM
ncbi:putative epoxide hydrolase [Xylaria bambusicola]|uniref:putative epoxide hydrolase n=1 Tax=Xylaria bambusicola TaxID=326684 RepID=UPI00200763B6|nr:putative epoxide hydrolase [Xylaria bambusicola]KAI0508528.1 putative epoxide hydrolase [Xylaria bambusicola]